VPYYQAAERNFDIFVRTHHGGSGGGPIYVAHLTEQEALGIIRNALTEAGLDFSDDVPAYEIAWGEEMIPITLYDAEKNQAVVLVDLPHNNRTWHGGTPWRLERMYEAFAWQTDIPISIFCCEGYTLGWPGWSEYDEWTAPVGGQLHAWDMEFYTDTTKEEQLRLAGPVLEQSLLAQVNAFIARLRAEGVLP